MMLTIEEIFAMRNGKMTKQLLHKFSLKEAYEQPENDTAEKTQINGTVMIPAELAEPMHHWHSGMGDPIYKVGSMAAANKPVSIDLVKSAKEELESIYDSVSDENDQSELDEIIAELGRILSENNPEDQININV